MSLRSSDTIEMNGDVSRTVLRTTLSANDSCSVMHRRTRLSAVRVFSKKRTNRSGATQMSAFPIIGITASEKQVLTPRDKETSPETWTRGHRFQPLPGISTVFYRIGYPRLTWRGRGGVNLGGSISLSSLL